MRVHSNIRLFISSSLAIGNKIQLDKQQSHYISNVMRRKLSDIVSLFNGQDGEFLAEIVDISKNNTQLLVKEKSKDQQNSPNLTLLYAPVKNAKNEFIVQKATEIGVKAIQPIITKFTIKDKTNSDKLKIVAIEAAEQCERLDIPTIHEITELEKALKNLSDYKIILCDETGKGESAHDVLTALKATKTDKFAVVIGPEGGFSDLEISIMHSMKNVHAIGLGPRILRAETAIITALALVQNYLGDFAIQPDFRG